MDIYPVESVAQPAAHKKLTPMAAKVAYRQQSQFPQWKLRWVTRTPISAKLPCVSQLSKCLTIRMSARVCILQVNDMIPLAVSHMTRFNGT